MENRSKSKEVSKQKDLDLQSQKLKYGMIQVNQE